MANFLHRGLCNNTVEGVDAKNTTLPVLLMDVTTPNALTCSLPAVTGAASYRMPFYAGVQNARSILYFNRQWPVVRVMPRYDQRQYPTDLVHATVRIQ